MISYLIFLLACAFPLQGSSSPTMVIKDTNGDMDQMWMIVGTGLSEPTPEMILAVAPCQYDHHPRWGWELRCKSKDREQYFEKRCNGLVHRPLDMPKRLISESNVRRKDGDLHSDDASWPEEGAIINTASGNPNFFYPCWFEHSNDLWEVWCGSDALESSNPNIAARDVEADPEDSPSPELKELDIDGIQDKKGKQKLSRREDGQASELQETSGPAALANNNFWLTLAQFLPSTIKDIFLILCGSLAGFFVCSYFEWSLRKFKKTSISAPIVGEPPLRRGYNSYTLPRPQESSVEPADTVSKSEHLEGPFSDAPSYASLSENIHIPTEDIAFPAAVHVFGRSPSSKHDGSAQTDDVEPAAWRPSEETLRETEKE